MDCDGARRYGMCQFLRLEGAKYSPPAHGLPSTGYCTMQAVNGTGLDLTNLLKQCLEL